jgi:hypothetical protein
LHFFASSKLRFPKIPVAIPMKTQHPLS